MTKEHINLLYKFAIENSKNTYKLIRISAKTCS